MHDIELLKIASNLDEMNASIEEFKRILGNGGKSAMPLKVLIYAYHFSIFKHESDFLTYIAEAFRPLTADVSEEMMARWGHTLGSKNLGESDHSEGDLGA
jgi:hypothetical protein